jgi:SAM-dependent methyltransferase
MAATTTNEIKHQSANPLLRFALRRFFEVVNRMMPAASVVIDAGCGEGYGVREIQQQRGDMRFYGVDLSAQALHKSRQISAEMPVCVADVTRLPFADKCADVVLSLEVLEHLPDPAAAITEYKRVSRRYILVSTPNEPLFRLLRMARGDNIGQWGNHPEHVNHWNLLSLQKFLAGHDLRIGQAAIPPPFIWSVVLGEIRE